MKKLTYLIVLTLAIFAGTVATIALLASPVQACANTSDC